MVARNLIGIVNHTCDKVVGIYYRSLTRLHLTVRQLNHTVREVYEILTPLESEFVEKDRENLEVIVLLVTYYVDHLVDRVVLETELCSTDVLSHIDRSTV